MILAVGMASEHVRLLGLGDRTRLANLRTADELEVFLAREDEWWELVLLGPGLEAPLRAAQRVKLRHPDVLALVLAPPESVARVQHELLLTPLRGEPVRVVALDEHASRIIEQHLTQAKLRRRHTQALRQASLEVPERPATTLRLPSVVERFFEAAPGAVYLLDEGGRVIHANGAGRALLPEGSGGAPLADSLPVADRGALRALIERARADSPARLAMPGPPKRVFDAVAAHAQPAPDRQGTLVTLHDVTALVQTELDREREARLHQTLLEAQAQLGIGILVLEGPHVTYVNKAMTDLTGYSEEELRGALAYNLVAPEERPRVRERHERRLRGEPVEAFYETVFLRKDGERVHVEASARSLGAGSPTIILLRDTTSRRRMAEELEHTRRAVAQMDKLASMGSLVGGLAHEIRTPLTAIMNNVNVLDLAAKRALADERPDVILEALPAQVEAINENVDRIRALVKDMNRFMRGETPHKTVCHLNGPVMDAARLFQASQRGRVLVEATVGSTRQVDADPAQVQQIVINLLQNAAEASPSGATVWVRTRDAADGGVEVEVEDRGRGIPLDLQPRIFEAFVTTKPGGTGLGLAIVRRLAEIHGARIECSSRPDEGTRFVVRFPAV